MTLLWCDLESRIPIDDSKQYVLLFQGCFGPPHSGHLRTLERLAHCFDLQHRYNVHFIINQFGWSKRHGVSFEFNKYLMELYMDTLGYPKDRYTLCTKRTKSALFSLQQIQQSDVLYMFRGRETKRGHKKEHVMKMTQSRCESLYRSYVPIQSEFHVLMSERQYDHEQAVSSTLFIQTLQKYKNKLHQDLSCTELRHFIPEGISDARMNWIVKNLMLMPLK